MRDGGCFGARRRGFNQAQPFGGAGQIAQRRAFAQPLVGLRGRAQGERYQRATRQGRAVLPRANRIGTKTKRPEQGMKPKLRVVLCPGGHPTTGPTDPQACRNRSRAARPPLAARRLPRASEKPWSPRDPVEPTTKTGSRGGATAQRSVSAKTCARKRPSASAASCAITVCASRRNFCACAQWSA